MIVNASLGLMSINASVGLISVKACSKFLVLGLRFYSCFEGEMSS